MNAAMTVNQGDSTMAGGGYLQFRVDGNEVIDGSGEMDVSWEDGLMVGANISDGNHAELLGMAVRLTWPDQLTEGRYMGDMSLTLSLIHI